MEFFIKIAVITASLGGFGYLFLGMGEKNTLLGILGAFFLIGAAGGLLLVGFFVAVYVWQTVSDITFGLLGAVVALPFVIGPVYLIWKITNGRHRESDGRGFGDGDGSD
jgi:hypothetical protein